MFVGQVLITEFRQRNNSIIFLTPKNLSRLAGSYKFIEKYDNIYWPNGSSFNKGFNILNLPSTHRFNLYLLLKAGIFQLQRFVVGIPKPLD